MNFRALQVYDIFTLKNLHDKYFGEEFNCPDFTKMLGAFVVTDDNDKIIMGGGVRKIGETLLVTDKGHPSKTELGRALIEAQNISRYICELNGIEWLHAFVKDEKYARHLIKHGFNPRCQALSMKV